MESVRALSVPRTKKAEPSRRELPRTMRLVHFQDFLEDFSVLYSTRSDDYRSLLVDHSQANSFLVSDQHYISDEQHRQVPCSILFGWERNL